ncbi:MAG: histidine kinase dimerization/phospho-acceptor domain-containing protein, partial [Myxococcota bacterium]
MRPAVFGAVLPQRTMSSRPPAGRAHAALRLLDAAPDPVVLFDAERWALGWNRAAEALFGDLLAIGLPLRALLAGEKGSVPPSREGTHHEVWARSPAGRVPVELRLVARPDAPGSVAFFRDLSAPRRAAAALQRARRDAEVANAAKTRFLAMMSHELRTPLHAVLGHAELLMDGPGLEDDQRAMLKVIERSAETLSSLIEDLLDLPRIERGE